VNIQSLLAEFPAFVHKQTKKPVEDDENKDLFANLTPGSSTVPISLPLLEALAHLSSVGARDNSVAELKSANESARRILQEYMKVDFAGRKEIPKAFTDLFTPGAQSEINWEGVVLKIHQSYLESPELQNIMQKILRTQEEESPAPMLKQSLERFPFKNRFLREEAPTPEMPSRSSHPKLLKGLQFVPVKPDADKRTIVSVVPNAKPEEQLSPLEDRRKTGNNEDSEEDGDYDSRRRAVINQLASYNEESDSEDNTPKLSNSFKETLTFPRSGMSSAPPAMLSPSNINPPSSSVPSKVTTGFSVGKTTDTDVVSPPPTTLNTANRKKRTSFVGGPGGQPVQPFLVDDPSILSNKFTDNLMGSKGPIVDTMAKASSVPEDISPLHLEAIENPQIEQEAEVKNMMILDPATAYRREFYKERNEVKNSEFVRRGDNGIVVDHLPSWFNVVVYWGEVPAVGDKVTIPVDFICLANSARGHYDFALQMAIIHQLKTLLKAADISSYLKPTVDHWVNARSFVIESKCFEYLRSEFEAFRQARWTERIYNEYVSDIIASRGNDFDFNQIIVTLESELLLLRRVKHLPSLDLIERLLVSLLGDDRVPARESAVRLLNILHDGHDFQSLQALTPVVRTIGDSFVVEVDISEATVEEGGAYLLVYGPSLSGGSKSVLSRYTPSLRGTRLRVSQLPSFKKAGYYDWRFVTVNKDGLFIPLLSRTLDLNKIQGRVIVHPPIRDEIMHEISVELQGCEWDRSGKITRRGTFASVAKALPELKRSFGISTVYVNGALERNHGAPTFSVTDRSAPAKSLGGSKEFDDLLTTAKDTKIKIIVDGTARISAKGMNRKYKNLLCKTVDSGTDSIIIHPGTDGKDFRWQDCAHLNWRKKSVWDLTVNEIRQWALRGVSGVRLDSAQTWPLILRPNLAELLRVDNDGERHYTKQEILDGEIVLPSSDEGLKYGYFGSAASNTYANPFFIKMTREIWREFPNFVFLAEVFWNREREAIISGLVPYSNGLSRSLTSIFNLGLHKDGSLSHLTTKKSVSVFYDWYQIERASYPQNSMLIYPSASHHIHYPTSMYGTGAWAAVDMMAFLPETPMTFVGEQLGWMRNFDSSSGRFILPNITPPGGDLASIRGHYEHRMLLRKNTPVLREGGMIPIFAFYKQGWHDRVFGFARFTRGQEGPNLALVAINFNDAESYFHLDLSPLKEICETGEYIYRVVDLINPTNPPIYYTPDEFLFENDYSRLAPYASLCKGVFIQAASPTSQRVLFEHSMARLKAKIKYDVAPTKNMIYDLLFNGFSSFPAFEKATMSLLHQGGPLADTSLPEDLQKVLYFMSTLGDEGVAPAKIVSYLKYLTKKNTDPMLNKLLTKTLEWNTLGPLVFVTPELGRFSTVGGVGVMVNELTQALAALGAEVHVISPYYNYDRKGKTGYLKEEGITYRQNLITYVGNEYLEVGVHYGFEHGVHLHFLHNYKYFTTPYQAGSPVYQLSSIVLMAKASLELCCQLRIFPSVIICNDWYTGLIPAYGKKSGAFGKTFAGTTFFYLVHNLEEGYEGKIYPETDLGYIHHLPTELVNEGYPARNVINASLSALLCSDQWGTVSLSYRNDLMRVSPMGGLLRSFKQPFAHLNGVRLHERLAILAKVASSHEDAKMKLQKKYFDNVDPAIPIFCFVGRIVLQKGVHIILNAVHELINVTKGKIQIIIGGMASMKDPYAAQCAWSMQGLRRQYPSNLWADPNEFFTDGALVNYGSDFGLMPSLFEPSGVVQQEFFAGGTPVIAFKTGGLKDSVFEFNATTGQGNGFTFEAHSHSDFVQAMKRALVVYNNPADYACLRAATRETVLDVTKVANGWMGEFVRLRGRVWADQEETENFIKEIEQADKPQSAAQPAQQAQQVTEKA